MATNTRFMNLALRNGRFKTSVILVVFVVLFAVVGPMIRGADPQAIVGGPYQGPSAKALLGTDNFGRDELTVLMYGTRTSLEIGVVAGIIAVIVGVVIGTLAGYYGGVFAEILMGFTNIVITIPSIIILILLSIALGTRSTFAMGIIIGVTSWPWTARAVAAQTSSLRTREHIDIARLSGAGDLSIILSDVIPYVLSYIGMAFSLQLASAVLTEAGLSLLGLGPSNTISLGILLQWALLWEAVRQGIWWTFVPPTILLALVSFGLLLLNSSMDELYNPRLQQQKGAA
ncbi:MAG TPA: ABC transporter permease [Spirochaetia bacterium]|nr:ABC transporter permease [Spirochaetia bacterium]